MFQLTGNDAPIILKSWLDSTEKRLGSKLDSNCRESKILWGSFVFVSSTDVSSADDANGFGKNDNEVLHCTTRELVATENDKTVSTQQTHSNRTIISIILLSVQPNEKIITVLLR